MTEADAAAALREYCRHGAPFKRKTAAILLFGMEYANKLRGLDLHRIALEGAGRESHQTTIRDGMAIAEYKELKIATETEAEHENVGVSQLAFETAALNNRLKATVEMVETLAELLSGSEQSLPEDDCWRHSMFRRLENIQNKSREIIDELIGARRGFISLAVSRETIQEEEE